MESENNININQEIDTEVSLKDSNNPENNGNIMPDQIDNTDTQEFENQISNQEVNANADLPECDSKSQFDESNIALYIPINLSVVLGEVNLSIRDIMDLQEDSVIELDKEVGSKVDLYANNHFIGKGELIKNEMGLNIKILDLW